MGLIVARPTRLYIYQQAVAVSFQGRPRVLLVEDDPDTRAMVKQLLKRSFNVVSAADAKEALRLLGGETFGDEMPDLFLLDIRLGEGRDGAEVLGVLRDLEPTQEVPAVAITTHAMAGDREALLSVGFDEYVSKPFVRAELSEAIKEALFARRS